MQLSKETHKIAFNGKGGKYIKDLTSDLPCIVGFKPQLVIIDIGSNDIDRQVSDPDVLARQVYDFFNTLVSLYGVKSVLIFEVLNRTCRGKYGSKCERTFRTIANKYNNELKDIVLSPCNVTFKF